MDGKRAWSSFALVLARWACFHGAYILEGDFTPASTNMAVWVCWVAGKSWLGMRVSRAGEEYMIVAGGSLELGTARMTGATFWRLLVDPFALSSQQAFHLAREAWFVWVVWWVAMAFFSKSTKRRETVAQRIEHLVPALLGFLFVFQEGFGGTFLARRIFPDSAALMLVSVVMTILGLLFAVWARLTLGANWSGTVTIKRNHQLIRRGPYRWIRHPIYTGMLAALLATAVAQGLLSGLIGFAFLYLALYRKARREESFLSREFGEGFAEHRQRTGMFLPRLS
jgi:protein-S-isoprenylcysteine O-methyltransferase Ste14